MSVVTSIMSSLHVLLSTRRGTQVVQHAHRVEAIREAMLDCLAQEGSPGFSPLERSVLLAADVQALWYLRAELLMALAAGRGESAARAALEQISAMFDGLLPQGLRSRCRRPAR